MKIRRTTVAAAAVVALSAPAAGLGAPLAAAAGTPVPAVHADAETPPLFDDEAGGNANADDPAIWRDPDDPAASLVIGTAKEGGLRAYGLDGHEIQSLPAPAAPAPGSSPGRINNVDVVNGVRLDGASTDLAVASDRGRDRLRLYRIDRSHPSAPLTDATSPDAPRIFSPTEADVDQQLTAYGVTAWRDPDSGDAYAAVTQRHRTGVTVLHIVEKGDGTLTYEPVRTASLPSAFDTPDGTWSPCEKPGRGAQAEGVVADPEHHVLYVAQEDVGIWRFPTDLSGSGRLVDTVRGFGAPAHYDEASDACVQDGDPGLGGRHLAADVEGLTLYRHGGRQYLLASSQGDDTYAAYRTGGDGGLDFAGSFRIADGDRTDGTQETDGLSALGEPLGPDHPDGLVAVQDGANTPGDGSRTDTDFKLVDAREVLSALPGAR